MFRFTTFVIAPALVCLGWTAASATAQTPADASASVRVIPPVRGVDADGAGARVIRHSPDGRMIFVGEEDGSIGVFQRDNGTLLRRIRLHAGPVRALATTEDGRQLVSGGADRFVRHIDVDRGVEIRNFRHTEEVTGVDISADGRRIVSGSRDRTVVVRNAADGAEIDRFDAAAEVAGTRMTADGRLIFVCGMGAAGRFAILRDVDAKKEVRRFADFADDITAMDMTRDGRRALVGLRNGRVVTLDPNAGTAVRIIDRPGDAVTSVAIDRTGGRGVYAVGRRAFLYEPETGRDLGQLDRPQDPPARGVGITADGRGIAVGGDRPAASAATPPADTTATGTTRIYEVQ